ncbi:MAG: glycine--tRNA ligase subunit alpha, partial [Sphingobium sp.]|nr:glycine--tRNA ligase subunit alpha [Sphingobium sp.]
FEVADTEKLFRWFKDCQSEWRQCIDNGVPLAAFEQAIKASHTFNLLQARGVISVQERASYMGQVRDMAKGSCEAWMESNGWTA